MRAVADTCPWCDDDSEERNQPRPIVLGFDFFHLTIKVCDHPWHEFEGEV